MPEFRPVFPRQVLLEQTGNRPSRSASSAISLIDAPVMSTTASWEKLPHSPERVQPPTVGQAQVEEQEVEILGLQASEAQREQTLVHAPPISCPTPPGDRVSTRIVWIVFNEQNLHSLGGMINLFGSYDRYQHLCPHDWIGNPYQMVVRNSGTAPRRMLHHKRSGAKDMAPC